MSTPNHQYMPHTTNNSSSLAFGGGGGGFAPAQAPYSSYPPAPSQGYYQWGNHRAPGPSTQPSRPSSNGSGCATSTTYASSAVGYPSNHQASKGPPNDPSATNIGDDKQSGCCSSCVIM